MKQVQMITAGLQRVIRQVLCTSENYFAYCSTTGIYIGSLKNRRIERIIAGHSKKITAIMWNPFHENIIASASEEKDLILWDILEENKKTRFELPSIVRSIQWSCLNPNNIFLLLENGEIHSVKLDEEKVLCIASFSGEKSKIFCLHPKDDNIYVIGGEFGTLVFYSIKEKKTTYARHSQNYSVVDAQWNPNENYLLACYVDSTIKLFEAHSEIPSFEFDQQGIGIKCLTWMHNMSGDFITGSEKIGALRFWNVSQKIPKRTQKVGSAGILAIYPFKSSSDIVLIGFKDGQVSVYSVKKGKPLFSTSASHAETIFELKFKPSDPNILATASYDGTVKIWDIENVSLLATLSHKTKNANGEPDIRGQIVSGISWMPDASTRLMTCCSKGTLWLWDYQKNQVLSTLQPGRSYSSIDKIDWNPLNPEIAACGSQDHINYYYVKNLD